MDTLPHRNGSHDSNRPPMWLRRLHARSFTVALVAVGTLLTALFATAVTAAPGAGASSSTPAALPHSPAGITTGPDGNLWFTNFYTDPSIGKLDPTTGATTYYTNASIDTPDGIVVGPDGALWFTNCGNNSIGRITTNGVVTAYTGAGVNHPDGDHGRSRRGDVVHQLRQQLDRAHHHQGSRHQLHGRRHQRPTGIAAGPDGALWFTNNGSNSIGRITTNGVVAYYTDPAGTINEPKGIVSAPGGAPDMWFMNGNGSVGKIATGSATPAITSYSDPVHPFSGSDGITVGPDGNLWSCNTDSNSISRITPAGAITTFSDATIGAPDEITSGPDGAIWFTTSATPRSGASPPAGRSPRTRARPPLRPPLRPRPTGAGWQAVRQPRQGQLHVRPHLRRRLGDRPRHRVLDRGARLRRRGLGRSVDRSRQPA